MKRGRLFIALAIAAGIASIPAIAREDTVHLIVVTGIWIIVASGLNLLTGYMGYVSFGQAGFFGLGAYISALLSKMGLSVWLSFPVAALVTGGVGVLLGLGILRLSGAYFAIGTLVLGEVLYSLYYNWSPVTGGYMGLMNIPPLGVELPFTGEVTFSLVHWFYFINLVVLLLVIVIRKLVRSQFGRELIAIRQNESLAESLGVNVKARKLQCFAISCLLAGLGGAFYSHFMGHVSPASFTVGRSLEFITIVIIGGLASLIGPFFGSYVLIIMSLYMEFLGAWRMVVYGLIIIFVMMFARGGIVSAVEKCFRVELRR